VGDDGIDLVCSRTQLHIHCQQLTAASAMNVMNRVDCVLDTNNRTGAAAAAVTAYNNNWGQVKKKD